MLVKVLRLVNFLPVQNVKIRYVIRKGSALFVMAAGGNGVLKMVCTILRKRLPDNVVIVL